MAKTDEGALVEAARAGDSQAFGQLFDLWFDRVHDLSRRIVKDPGTAGEVAQDAFLSAWTRLDSLQDPDAFGGWLLRIARNASLNRLAKERRSVALDHETMTTITDLDAPDHDPLAHMDQAARVDLVWDAAAALGERDMSVLDLHLRHGLGAAELADELGTTPNNAHQILFTLKKRLGTNVRALVLWRAGRPACEDLRRTLSKSGIAVFDKQAVKVIDRHAQVCSECDRTRTERLAPAALFGAAPVVAAPILLKSQAASALEAAGVPMGGSAAHGAGAGSTGSGSTGSGSTGSGSTSGGVSGSGSTAVGGSAGTSGSAAPGTSGLAVPSTGGEGPGSVAAAAGDGTTSDDGGGVDHSEAVGSETAPASRRRGRAVAAVLAALVVLVAVVVAVSSALDPDGGPSEVLATGDAGEPRAGDGDADAPDTGGALTDGSAPGGVTTSTTTTAPGGGGLVVGEVVEDPAAGPTAPPSDDVVTPPTPPTPTAPPPPPGPGPGPGGPTAPPVTPAPPPETTGTTAPVDTTRPAPPPQVPEIVVFTATSDGTQCRGGLVYQVVWSTRHATTVTVGASSGARLQGEPEGSTSICTAVGAAAPTFVLVASGPGGDDQQVITGRVARR